MNAARILWQSLHTRTVLLGIVHRYRYFCGSEALPTQGLDSITSPHCDSCMAPPDTHSAWPFAGKTGAWREGTDFPRSRTRFETGPAWGAGETSPPILEAGRGAGEGEVSPWQKLGCCYGAGPWEGGIPSNPSHPSLPHPPGNLNLGFSRGASTGAPGHKTSSSLTSLVPQTAGTNNNNNIIKVASTQPSLGAGFGWQRSTRRGGSPRAYPIPAAPHGARAPSTKTYIFRVSPPRPSCVRSGDIPDRSKVMPGPCPARSPPTPPQPAAAQGRGTPPSPGGSPDFGGYL